MQLLALVAVLGLICRSQALFLQQMDNYFVPNFGDPANAASQKLTGGYEAHFEDAAGDIDITKAMKVEWRIYENFDGWNDGAPDLAYASCVLLKYGGLMAATKVREEASTSATGTKTGCKLTKAGRIWSIALSLDAARAPATPTGELSTLTECQGYKDGTTYYYAVHCQREEGHDHEFDAVFLFSLDSTNIQHALAATIDDQNAGVNIGNMAKEIVTRGWEVSLDSMLVSDPTDLTTATVIAAGTTIELGSNIQFRVCLSITDSVRQVFENNWSYLGVYVYSCTASMVGTDFDPNDPPMNAATGRSETVIEATGCGSASSPMKAWATDSYVFKYYQADLTATDEYLMSPNCWTSSIFEGVRFQSTNHGGPSSVQFTCSIRYCSAYDFTGTDQKCWGDGVADGDLADGYPPCAKRKRREAAEEDSDLHHRTRRQAVNNMTFKNPWDAPTSLTTTYTIVLPEAQTSQETSCFEQTTFVGLTSALTFILVLVVTTAAFLSCRIRNLSKLSDRHSSVGGFSNKAFN